MLSAFFDDDGNDHQPELITIGEVEEGDIYQDRCCKGFGWEVSMISTDDLHPNYTTYWGKCLNNDCQNYQHEIGEDDPYRGVSYINHEDLSEWLAYRDSNLTSHCTGLANAVINKNSAPA